MSALAITIIQTHLFWEDKAANLRMLREKILHIPEPTEIVILPEMFSTGFSMQPQLLAEKMDGHTIDWMRNLAAQKRIILTGSVIIEEDGKYFNRLIWMLPNGAYGYYDKRHLFAYTSEDKQYSAGNKRLIASVKGWKINLQICYDLRFPVWVRQKPADTLFEEAHSPEYDLMINVANWPKSRIHAWRTLLQARAIENQCYVAGVNRIGNDGNGIYHSGCSIVVNPLGMVLYEKEDEEVIHTSILQKEELDQIRKKYPFWKDADHFLINP